MPNERTPQNPASAAAPEQGFVERVLIAYGLGAVFLLLAAAAYFATQVFLLLLASILLAVLLNDAAAALERHTPMSHGLSLVVVLASALAVLALGGWLLAPRVSEQAAALAAELPRALQRARDFLEARPVWQHVSEALPSPEQAMKDASSFLLRAQGVFSGLAGVIGNAVIVLFLAIYLAWQPKIYTGGILKLLPPERRRRGREVFGEVGRTLSLWLRGKLFSMAVIGVATAAGLYMIGVPMAMVLGIVAGLLDFIPYIGPILAAIPAVLIAFLQGPVPALYVVLLFFGIQMLQGYLLLPLVERKAVSLPPALTIFMQVLMGIAFGLFGVALATPLTAIIVVAVAMLYVQDELHDPVRLPSEKK